MIAISWSDYMKYGCPSCGCDYARGSYINGRGTSFGTCRECNTSFAILTDGQNEAGIGIGTGKKDENGEDIIEYPKLQKHPRIGIPWHPYEFPDPRPEYGEYWISRGIGYDLSGFVKSKKAGERIYEMVKKILGKEKPDSWLDWREHEPSWIQFKFQGNEFDLEKLNKMAVHNKNILTKEILIACKL